MFEYPGGFSTSGDGESRARVRLQESEASFIVARGVSTARSLAPGTRFTFKGHFRSDQESDYLLTSLVHNANQGGDFRSGSATSEQLHYGNRFGCIPFSTPYRPPRRTPRPVIPGAQTGVVVGKSGEEIWTDKYGRVKVQFHWDRYSKADENSSCWVRVAQASAGKNWGSIVLPRIGQEVVISFLDGDPDRPLVTGRVYNAERMPPYDLPSEQTKSTMKTDSSKGSSGFNEIRFEDAAGNEQIFIHAERNQDVRIKKDSMENVGNESHRTVSKDDFQQISGDQHLTVKGDQNGSVEGTISLKAGSDLQAKVGQNYGLDAGTEVYLKAGMNLVLESGTTLTLKSGGNFINLNPGGVFISGTMVMINSGGSAGSGSGVSPQSPKSPKDADDGTNGQMAQPKPKQPPKPAKYSPAAIVLKQAAQSGAPFCDT
jgi:type VI secretion system secreted protein VgrG